MLNKVCGILELNDITPYYMYVYAAFYIKSGSVNITNKWGLQFAGAIYPGHATLLAGSIMSPLI